MGGFSGRHPKHGCDLRHGHVLFDCGPTRSIIRMASPSAGTEVMGFFHFYADARMPIWGVLAILSNLFLGLLTRGGHRGLYLLSVSVLILFVVLYDRLSKPINRLQTEAAKTRGMLD